MTARTPSLNAVLRAMYDLARRERGVSASEAAAAAGGDTTLASARLRWMVRTKRLEQRPSREGRTQKRYFAFHPRENFDAMERRVALEQAARSEQRIKAANARLASSARCKVIKPRNGGPTVTIAPRPRERYEVDRVPRYFSAVAIGSYPLSADTWARRVTEGAA